MRHCSKKSCITKNDILGTRLDLHLYKTAVRSFHHRINRVVIHERQINVETLLQHESYDVVFDSLSKSGAVAVADSHKLEFSGEGLVQQRFFQSVQRGELLLVEAGEALGFFPEGV